MKTKIVLSLALVAGTIASQGMSRTPEKAPDAKEIQALAEEAYIYALPILMSYKTMYQYAVDSGNPNFKAPFNELKNTARVYGPKDTTVISANSDTPYSLLWCDLRAEPVVLTFPKIATNRYFVAQSQDLSTYLLPYIGSRTTGNNGGTFMITGPDWNGKIPKGIDKVIPCTSDFSFTVYRVQLFNSKDLENVKKVQSGFKVQNLSEYLGQSAPPAAVQLDFPDWKNQKEPGNDFIAYLNFCLNHITPDKKERALLKKLAPIGVGPGQVYNYDKLPADQQAAIAAGVKSAQEKIAKSADKYSQLMAGQTRKNYNYDWLWRAYVTKMGWGANDPREASYPLIETDASGAKLDASKGNYTLTFAKGKLPPVNAFWSVTMYDGTSQLMIENPLNRYLLNSPMLPDMKKNADGSLTLYLQKDSPGKELEANWLPAPDGTFYMLLRVYWPKESFLDKSWVLPDVQKAQ